MALSFLAASAPTCECCRRWHGCRAPRPEDCEIVVNRGLVPDQVDGLHGRHHGRAPQNGGSALRGHGFNANSSPLHDQDQTDEFGGSRNVEVGAPGLESVRSLVLDALVDPGATTLAIPADAVAAFARPAPGSSPTQSEDTLRGGVRRVCGGCAAGVRRVCGGCAEQPLDAA